jgi:aryl-alcohol dehydrogenase-like predicted oxidoreductase
VVAAGQRAARWCRAQGARGQPALRRQREADAGAKRPQLEAYEDLCAEAGEEPGTVGLAWLLTRPAVTGPIVGPRTPEQLESALHAVDVTLDDKVLARLDEIFPGHKTAPEDYAW